MEEQFTTYTVKSRADGYVWQFKYTLNGNLYAFKVLEGSLTVNQKLWLFQKGHFPSEEAAMKIWQKKLKANFEIEIGEPDLSFEAFWNAYAHKVGKKKMAQNSWEKLSKANKIKAMMGIKRYDNHLRLYPGVQKAHPSTYLNQEYYNNEY